MSVIKYLGIRNDVKWLLSISNQRIEKEILSAAEKHFSVAGQVVGKVSSMEVESGTWSFKPIKQLLYLALLTDKNFPQRRKLALIQKVTDLIDQRVMDEEMGLLRDESAVDLITLEQVEKLKPAIERILKENGENMDHSKLILIEQNIAMERKSVETCLAELKSLEFKLQDDSQESLLRIETTKKVPSNPTGAAVAAEVHVMEKDDGRMFELRDEDVKREIQPEPAQIQNPVTGAIGNVGQQIREIGSICQKFKTNRKCRICVYSGIGVVVLLVIIVIIIVVIMSSK